MRQVRLISKIQPLQMDTVHLVPNSYIPGDIQASVNVVGSNLASKVVTSRNLNIGMPDGTYRVEVTVVGAVGVGKFKITDIDRSMVTAEIATSATAIAGLIAGVNIVVPDTTGCAVGHYCEFTVIGDQTYIIPGTILGRVIGSKEYRPASEATIAQFDAFTIAQTFQETDKTKTVLPHGYENNVSQVYTVDVVVYGQIIETACRKINMGDNLKAKLTHINWL